MKPKAKSADADAKQPAALAAPKTIAIPPEVEGYIVGLKDQIATQSEMIAQRTAEIFGLRAQLAAALAQSGAKETK
jgi:hypothetical protein